MKNNEFDQFGNKKENEYVDEIINGYVNDQSYYTTKGHNDFNSFKKSYVIIIICFFVAILGGFFGSFAYNFFWSIGSEILSDKSENTDNKSASVSYVNNAVADAVDKVADCVVDIEAEVSNKKVEEEDAGSGLIYSSDGYIITNENLIRDAKKVKVTFNNGEVYNANIIGSDAKNDVAVLKINETKLSPVTFGDSSSVRKGEDIFVIGNPLGELSGSVTNGIVSAKNRELELEGSIMSLIQTNAEINSGNSGGGVFKLNGELIGVVIAKSTGEDLEGLGFVIPSNTVKTCVEKLIKKS